jgi:hypothetical protein
MFAVWPSPRQEVIKLMLEVCALGLGGTMDVFGLQVRLPWGWGAGGLVGGKPPGCRSPVCLPGRVSRLYTSCLTAPAAHLHACMLPASTLACSARLSCFPSSSGGPPPGERHHAREGPCPVAARRRGASSGPAGLAARILSRGEGLLKTAACRGIAPRRGPDPHLPSVHAPPT